MSTKALEELRHDVDAAVADIDAKLAAVSAANSDLEIARQAYLNASSALAHHIEQMVQAEQYR